MLVQLKLQEDFLIHGYCVNEKCKELIYCIEGKGTLNKRNETIDFQKGDVILIDKGEIYYWDADCELVMPCTPAWYPEQSKMLADYEV